MQLRIQVLRKAKTDCRKRGFKSDHVLGTHLRLILPGALRVTAKIKVWKKRVSLEQVRNKTTKNPRVWPSSKGDLDFDKAIH